MLEAGGGVRRRVCAPVLIGPCVAAWQNPDLVRRPYPGIPLGLFEQMFGSVIDQVSDLPLVRQDLVLHLLVLVRAKEVGVLVALRIEGPGSPARVLDHVVRVHAGVHEVTSVPEGAGVH